MPKMDVHAWTGHAHWCSVCSAWNLSTLILPDSYVTQSYKALLGGTLHFTVRLMIICQPND